MNGVILTVNGGSSSVKFAVFSAGEKKRVLSGQIERIGQGGAKLVVKLEGSKDERAVNATDHRQAARAIAGYLKKNSIPRRSKPLAIASCMVAFISCRTSSSTTRCWLNRDAQPLDMTHLPLEIALIEEFQKSFPNLAEFACFDTAFHRDMPRVANSCPSRVAISIKACDVLAFTAFRTPISLNAFARFRQRKLPAASYSRTLAPSPVWPPSAMGSRLRRRWHLRPPPAWLWAPGPATLIPDYSFTLREQKICPPTSSTILFPRSAASKAFRPPVPTCAISLKNVPQTPERPRR